MKKATTKPAPKRISLFLVYLIFWLGYFGAIWANAIRVEKGNWYAAYIPHWADGAAHLSYMASFAYRDNFPTDHPLYLDHPFSYSFAADYLGGLLVKTGLALPQSYNLLGFLLSGATVISLWILLNSILKSASKTLLATSFFFFSGGLGWRFYLKSNPGEIDSFFFPLLTQIKGTHIVWLNTIVGELVPQRSFLLGLPLGCLLLYIFIRRFVFSLPVPSKWLFVSGIMLGLMPIIHPHTALILGSAIAIYGINNLIFYPKSRPKSILDLTTIALPSLSIGYFLASKFIFTAVSQGFFQYFPGWLAQVTQTNWLLFWLDNWGIFLPLALISTYKAPPKIRTIIIPFWLWFILANLFLFQPYNWDNSKLLTWVYLMFSLPVAQYLTSFPRNFLFRTICLLAIILMTFSGGWDALRLLDTKTHSLKLLDQEELSLAKHVRTNTSPTSIILTSTTHRNWVPIATGRQILCGYRGWMWTYGINDAQRFDDIKAIYRGAPQADRLIRSYGINYIVVGPEERYEFDVNQKYFEENYPIFHQINSTTIYAVN